MINGILSVRICQSPVDIIQIQIRAGAEVIACAHILFAKSVLRIEFMVSLRLFGTVGCDVGTSCTDTDTKIKPDSLVHAVIQHTCGIDAPEAAAYIHNTDFGFHAWSVPFFGKARFSISGKSLTKIFSP